MTVWFLRRGSALPPASVSQPLKMTRLGQDSRWLTHVLESGSGAAGLMGTPGRLAHYAQLEAVRPQPRGREERMAGFLFRLETVEGEPAEPPTLSAAVRTGSRETQWHSVDARCGSWPCETRMARRRCSWSRKLANALRKGPLRRFRRFYTSAWARVGRVLHRTDGAP